MTLPPGRLGDKGQRYLVEADGYPRDGTNTIGFSSSRENAAKMASAISLAPGCDDVRVIDRWKKPGGRASLDGGKDQ